MKYKSINIILISWGKHPLHQLTEAGIRNDSTLPCHFEGTGTILFVMGDREISKLNLPIPNILNEICTERHNLRHLCSNSYSVLSLFTIDFSPLRVHTILL